jgi:nucleoid-associated protein YgaU
MRTIGNIERFLVIGIVVVIGAILAVAIKGADDLDGAYKKQVAKANEARKSGATPLNRSDLARSSSGSAAQGSATGERVDKASTGTDTQRLSKAVEDLLKQRGGDKPDATTAPAGTVEKPDPSRVEPPSAPVGESQGTAPKPEPDSQAPVVLVDSKLPAGTPDGGGSAPTAPITRQAEKKEASASTALDWTYEVQPGDRLERVASTLYNDKSMWKEILAANPAYTDATRIRAGAVLVLPKAPVNTTATGLAHGATKVAGASPAEGHHEAKPVDGHAPQPAESGKATSFKRVTNSEKYEVQKGDTLMAIAAAHYGTRSAWRMILGANADSIADKDHLKPGTILKLPAE